MLTNLEQDVIYYIPSIEDAIEKLKLMTYSISFKQAKNIHWIIELLEKEEKLSDDEVYFLKQYVSDYCVTLFDKPKEASILKLIQNWLIENKS